MRVRAAICAAAVAVLALPAAAADAPHAPKSAREAAAAAARAYGKSDARGDDQTAQPGRGGDDLTTCKRDADGMRGPERSRFMTECLRERN